jgi:hypothetical protein
VVPDELRLAELMVIEERVLHDIVPEIADEV